MADTKRSREEKGKNKEAYRRERDIERAKDTADEDVAFEELLEPAEEDAEGLAAEPEVEE